MRLGRGLAILLLGLAAAGCEATVVGSNPEGIWFRDPFIGGSDMQGQANRHCARYGKTAVLQGTLDPAQGYALPITAYDCR